MPNATTPETTGRKGKGGITAGNHCLKAFCDCGGYVNIAPDYGTRLPAKMPARLVVLRDILGPPPGGYPAELLLPPGKVKDGGLGKVLYCSHHVPHDEVKVTTNPSDGKLRKQVAGTGARARVPLTEVQAAVATKGKKAFRRRASDVHATKGNFLSPARQGP